MYLRGRLLYRIYALVFVLLVQGCAYRMGSPERRIPGGYQKLAIPIFQNKTLETGIEVDFTNALITEFARSDVAHVTDSQLAEAILVGEVTQMTVIPGSPKRYDKNTNPYQPEGTVFVVDYRVVLATRIQVIDPKTQKTVWSGSFTGERSYNASQVTLPGVNSVNPNYNLSVKRRAIQTLAGEMMSEAFDRITENF